VALLYSAPNPRDPISPSLTRTPLPAAVCRQLDGLPLAIELAAVRTKLLSPRALLQRLDRRLAMLTSDHASRHHVCKPSERHRVSYDLLAPAEQALFRQLSVFVGGFSPAS
jgi:predicted ATPase